MTFYFVGIKGTGMASLARLLNGFGEKVLGSDIEKHTFTQIGLEEAGIKVLEFNPKNIKSDYIVIKGNAFSNDFPEIIEAKKIGAKVISYPEAVQDVIEKFISIGVAGAHGKTTTTGMLAKTLNSIEPISYLIGDGAGVGNKDSKYFVFEADEYQKHFAPYKPNFAIVTNVDFDHPDFFKDKEDVFDAFQEFADNIKETLFVNGDDELARKLNAKKVVTFGIDKNKNDYFASNIKKDVSGTAYDVFLNDKLIGNIKTKIAGDHGVIDSLGVFVLLFELGFDAQDVSKGIESFVGAERRFNIQTKNNITFVDDYAHHPKEIDTTIQAARQLFPNKKIISIFQPHTFSRVDAFGDEYAKSLSSSDYFYLTPIFGSAREANGDASSEDIGAAAPNFKGIITEENATGIFSKHKDDILIFMGAGDIQKYENLLVK